MYTGMALNTDIDKGVFDRFRSLPIWRPAVLVGMLLADAVALHRWRRSWSLALGLVLGFRPDGGVARRPRSPSRCCSCSRFSLSWVWTSLGAQGADARER